LSLAGNAISRLGTQLSPLRKLHTLNLAGNPLCDVADLMHLQALSALTTLHIDHPDYRLTPLAQGSETYRYLLLHLLPNLAVLDGHSAQDVDVREVGHGSKKTGTSKAVLSCHRGWVLAADSSPLGAHTL
jgi:hypothetical protein